MSEVSICDTNAADNATGALFKILDSTQIILGLRAILQVLLLLLLAKNGNLQEVLFLTNDAVVAGESSTKGNTVIYQNHTSTSNQRAQTAMVSTTELMRWCHGGKMGTYR